MPASFTRALTGAASAATSGALVRSSLPASSKSVSAGASILAIRSERNYATPFPRSYSTSKTSTSTSSSGKPVPHDRPNPTPAPIYPPTNNPFGDTPAPSASATPPSRVLESDTLLSQSQSQRNTAENSESEPNQAGASDGRKHSDLKIAIVKTLAKLMGYHTKSVTAIRETSRMCGEIVDAAARDHDYWYGACALPPTYQTFFQVHLLYLLILTTRLRALKNTNANPTATNTSNQYQTELLTHFFALAENQMRLTLGQQERERNVRKYMEEMGQQWKGAGVSFDYAIARGQNLPQEEKPEDRLKLTGELFTTGGDGELASWVWRNLFGARGAVTADVYRDVAQNRSQDVASSTSPSSSQKPFTISSEHLDELNLAIRLEEIVKFIRREVSRLESIPDQEVTQGAIGRFSRVVVK